MALIWASPPNLDNFVQTLSSDDINIGDVTTLVSNNYGIVAGYNFLVENYGNEKAEIINVTGVTGNNSITNTAYKFPHSVDTQLTYIKYDTVNFYSSATQTGTYTLLATVPMAVNYPDGTFYDDSTGSATAWYRFTYFNSINSVESVVSDSFQAAGIADESLKGIIDRFVKQANDPNEQRIDRVLAVKWVNEIYRKMQQEVRKADIQYGLKDSGALNLTSGVETYDLTKVLTNPAQIFRVWVAGNGAKYQEAFPLDLRDDDPNYTYSSYSPRYYFQDTSIGFKPTPVSGTYKILYYAAPVKLVSASDTLIYPYQDYTDMIVDYLMFRFSQIHKPTETDMYQGLVEKRMNEFKDDIVNRQIQYPDFVRIIDPALLMTRDEDVV